MSVTPNLQRRNILIQKRVIPNQTRVRFKHYEIRKWNHHETKYTNKGKLLSTSNINGLDDVEQEFRRHLSIINRLSKISRR